MAEATKPQAPKPDPKAPTREEKARGYAVTLDAKWNNKHEKPTHGIDTMMTDFVNDIATRPHMPLSDGQIERCEVLAKKYLK